MEQITTEVKEYNKTQSNCSIVVKFHHSLFELNLGCHSLAHFSMASHGIDYRRTHHPRHPPRWL